MKTICAWAIAALMWLPLIAASAGDSERLQAALRPDLDSGTFMGAVYAVRGDRTLLDKGYGFANLEWGVANTPATRFRIASVTKQFTAAAILLLQERGQLRLDDPVAKYLPDAPAGWRHITLYHLLTHTSGIVNLTDLPEYQDRRLNPATPDQLIAMVRDKPLDFPPGTRWSYSNSGYVILGRIIEKVSGQDYGSFLSAAFFKPLGLNDTGLDHAGMILPRRAAGYKRSGGSRYNADLVDASVLYAAGGLYSTTHDLVTWERALFGGKVLTAASLAAMTAPAVITPRDGAAYGFGLFVQTINGHRAFGHPGFSDGFSSETLVIPDQQVIIVVLANSQGDEAVMWATQLAAGLLPTAPDEHHS